MPSRLVKSNARLIVAITVVILGFVVSIAGSYALSLHAIDQSQRRWCATLGLIQNAKPPHATAFQQRYFTDLRELYRDFGC